MAMETLISFFMWCTIINMGVLLYWFIFMIFAHDWVYKIHTRWFSLSREDFDRIHYAGMAYYKIAVFMLFVIPYIVLLIIN